MLGNVRKIKGKIVPVEVRALNLLNASATNESLDRKSYFDLDWSNGRINAGDYRGLQELVSVHEHRERRKQAGEHQGDHPNQLQADLISGNEVFPTRQTRFLKKPFKDGHQRISKSSDNARILFQ